MKMQMDFDSSSQFSKIYKQKKTLLIYFRKWTYVIVKIAGNEKFGLFLNLI